LGDPIMKKPITKIGLVECKAWVQTPVLQYICVCVYVYMYTYIHIYEIWRKPVWEFLLQCLSSILNNNHRCKI
jgi:hypothetical protein